MTTKIEWAEESWNPVTGCSPISAGCQNCYARRMAQRLKGRFGYPEDDPFKVTFHIDRLDQPHRWKKPRRIFVCSMSDLFHKDVKGDWMWRILDSAYDSPSYHRHLFLFLTKRPEKMAAEMDNWMRCKALSSLPKRWWLGVTAENQQTADERIPILLQIPAAKRFVSIEPMLGPVDLAGDDGGQPYFPFDNEEGTVTPGLDWVIAGGESGPGARPMHPDWVRSVRDQCQEAGVPFFFKQWGEWKPYSEWFGGGIFVKLDGTLGCQGDYWYGGDAAAMNRAGKKKAGRLLDAREWNERP